MTFEEETRKDAEQLNKGERKKRKGSPLQYGSVYDIRKLDPDTLEIVTK